MDLVKVKTAELSGAALDWAVGKAEGKSNLEASFGRVSYGSEMIHGIPTCGYQWSPSTDWSQGGPLIEQFQIYLRPPHEMHLNFGNGRGEWRDYPEWSGTVSGRVGTIPSKLPGVFPDGVARGAGPTALIAACRAIVLLKLGGEVEVPQELIP